MCTGDPKEIRNAMQSYPSGHTATAFTVGIFLALYLNSKTKAFADYQTAYWKMFIVIIPILGACLASALVVIDGVRQHNIIDLKVSLLCLGVHANSYMFSFICYFTKLRYVSSAMSIRNQILKFSNKFFSVAFLPYLFSRFYHTFHRFY